MKISIDIPINFQVEERFGSINIRNNNGMIIIDRIGINFNGLEGYLDDFSQKNKILITNRDKFKVNQIDGMKAILKHTLSNEPDIKVYFFLYE